MTQDAPATLQRDRRVSAIIARIDRAVVEGRTTEDEEIGGLLVAISIENNRSSLHGRLVEEIEARYGMGPSGQAQEIFELLRRYCEHAAERLEERASNLEELKTGTLNYAIASCLGTGIATLTGAVVAGGAAATVGLGVGMLLLAGAGVAWRRRRLTHKQKNEVDRASKGLRALVGLLDRSSNR